MVEIGGEGSHFLPSSGWSNQSWAMAWVGGVGYTVVR